MRARADGFTVWEGATNEKISWRGSGSLTNPKISNAGARTMSSVWRKSKPRHSIHLLVPELVRMIDQTRLDPSLSIGDLLHSLREQRKHYSQEKFGDANNPGNNASS
jgi:hypothetical protein